MPDSAGSAARRWSIALVAVALLAVCVFALARLSDKKDGPAVAQDQHTSNATTTQATTQATTPPPTTPSPTCEGKNTLFNVSGTDKTSLLPDCGQKAVTVHQQEKTGLTLACGGSYPSIIFKTTTKASKSSICATNASGVKTRMVVAEHGGQPIDMAADYDGDLDGWIGRKDGTTYTVLGPNGEVVITRDGVSTKQKSTDFISLDNESDYD